MPYNSIITIMQVFSYSFATIPTLWGALAWFWLVPVLSRELRGAPCALPFSLCLQHGRSGGRHCCASTPRLRRRMTSIWRQCADVSISISVYNRRPAGRSYLAFADPVGRLLLHCRGVGHFRQDLPRWTMSTMSIVWAFFSGNTCYTLSQLFAWLIIDSILYYFIDHFFYSFAFYISHSSSLSFCGLCSHHLSPHHQLGFLPTLRHIIRNPSLFHPILTHYLVFLFGLLSLFVFTPITRCLSFTLLARLLLSTLPSQSPPLTIIYFSLNSAHSSFFNHNTSLLVYICITLYIFFQSLIWYN